jgi:hypothetical protein
MQPFFLCVPVCAAGVELDFLYLVPGAGYHEGRGPGRIPEDQKHAAVVRCGCFIAVSKAFHTVSVTGKATGRLVEDLNLTLLKRRLEKYRAFRLDTTFSRHKRTYQILLNEEAQGAKEKAKEVRMRQCLAQSMESESSSSSSSSSSSCAA